MIARSGLGRVWLGLALLPFTSLLLYFSTSLLLYFFTSFHPSILAHLNIMDLVQDTPAKRRKLANGDIEPSQIYDSQNDSGDDIFTGYETVATLPLSAKLVSASQNTADILSSPPAYRTQPTQPDRKSTLAQDGGGRKPSIVQVAGSSPTRNISPSPAPSRLFAGGKLASSMAPAGTAFRPPKGVIKAPPVSIVDISDDEPFMRAVSSDDDLESWCKADIKPSTFTHSNQKHGSKATKPGGTFSEILSNSLYKPSDGAEKSDPCGSTFSGSVYEQRNRDENRTGSRISTTLKASGDIMANAYGAARRPPKQIKQTGPAKALPLAELEIDDIEDYQLRSKIRRMRQILPHHTVRACKDALERKRYNFDDAMELLASQEVSTSRVDLTNSDGEDLISIQNISKKVPAKQQVKASNLKIQEKWTAAQNRSTQDLSAASHAPVAPKPRRRLVQGRKQQSSPVAALKQPSPIPSSRTATPDVGDSDSGLGTDLDSGLDQRVLKFFNTCSVADLVDLTAITEEIASVLLSQKPFVSLNEIRKLSSDVPGKQKTQRKTARKPFGDKIVDKCLDMLTAYEAIDELVKRCEELATPVKEDMKGWGVGATTEGELEIVSFERDISPRDSAIGTPNSIVVSDEEGISKKTRMPALFPQPLIMAEGIQLKDYQVRSIQGGLFVKDSSKRRLTM